MAKKSKGIFKSSPSVALANRSSRQPMVSSESSHNNEERSVMPFPPPPGRRSDITSSHETNVVVDGQTFKASAAALMLASPVWNMLLQDTLNPAQQTAAGAAGPPILNLDGSAKAMTTLLSIVHYRFAEVPATLTLSELYDLCLTMAQYKVTHLTYPWAHGWLAHLDLLMSSVTAGSTAATPTKDVHKALWIAYTLGEKTLYKAMLQSIILNLSRDADGHLVIAGAAKLNDMMLPPGLLDIIAETRTVLLDTMLSGVASAINPEDSSPPDSSICRVGEDVAECESMVIGSVMRALRRHKLFPQIPKASDYAASVQVLVDTLGAVKALTFVGQGSNPQESHDGCGLGLGAMVEGILADIPLVITDEHEKHLRIQGLESGIISCDVADTEVEGETVEVLGVQPAAEQGEQDLAHHPVGSPVCDKSSQSEEPDTLAVVLGIRSTSPPRPGW